MGFDIVARALVEAARARASQNRLRKVSNPMTPFQVNYRRWVRPLSLLGCVLALMSIILPGAAAPLASAAPPSRSAASQRVEPPVVGYATAADRTLIRWIWNRPGTPTFRVYRRQGDGAE